MRVEDWEGLSGQAGYWGDHEDQYRRRTGARRATAPLWGDRDFEVIAGTTLQACTVVPRVVVVGTAACMSIWKHRRRDGP